MKVVFKMTQLDERYYVMLYFHGFFMVNTCLFSLSWTWLNVRHTACERLSSPPFISWTEMILFSLEVSILLGLLITAHTRPNAKSDSINISSSVTSLCHIPTPSFSSFPSTTTTNLPLYNPPPPPLFEPLQVLADGWIIQRCHHWAFWLAFLMEELHFTPEGIWGRLTLPL